MKSQEVSALDFDSKRAYGGIFLKGGLISPPPTGIGLTYPPVSVVCVENFCWCRFGAGQRI